MIAREGIPLIFAGLVVTSLVLLAALRWDNLVLALLAGVLSLMTVFTVFFFRDPARLFEWQPRVLVSPADGRILSVDRIDHHKFVGGEAFKISIFLSIFDVHINRIPADGMVDFVKYNPGKFFPAFRDKASDENEHTDIGFTTSDGHKIVVKQIAGCIARRIVCHVAKGDTVQAGARFGMIRYGSRTELFVPVASHLQVKKGDHVKGGQTILGFLPEVTTMESVTEPASRDNVEL